MVKEDDFKYENEILQILADVEIEVSRLQKRIEAVKNRKLDNIQKGIRFSYLSDGDVMGPLKRSAVDLRRELLRISSPK